MVDQRFFTNHGPFSLADIASWTQTQLVVGDASHQAMDVAPLDKSSASDITFFDNTKYLEQFCQSQAGACFVREKYVEQAPKGMALLVSSDPYRSYAITAQRFYPFTPIFEGISDRAMIDPTATIGDNTTIGPGVVIARHVQIGANCIIGANTVIQDAVVVGDNTRIGALCTLSHCLIGEEVIIHRGVHIGQDGFGFAMGRDGHCKVPQLGRVVIEDRVEIGAATCIDRGTGPDTLIGEGSKIDNLVQIGHNVQIGKHSVIAAQTGISGSTRLGDYVVIGGQVGIAGHLKVGSAAKLAARTGVTADLTGNMSYGGTPAVPIKDWHRQVIALNRMIKKSTRGAHDRRFRS